jgi:hypothetical protein
MMASCIQRQLSAPPANNPLGPFRLQIIERTYMPSLVPGCPPVLVKTVEGKLQAF